MVAAYICLLAKQYTYSRNEKLKSKKELDFLFSSKKNFLVFPFKVVYSFNDIVLDDRTIKFGVGVSKKYFAHAVQRNRIKRLAREAFRRNKEILHNHISDKQLSFFVLYIDKEMPTHQMNIDGKMLKVFQKLIQTYVNENTV